MCNVAHYKLLYNYSISRASGGWGRVLQGECKLRCGLGLFYIVVSLLTYLLGWVQVATSSASEFSLYFVWISFCCLTNQYFYELCDIPVCTDGDVAIVCYLIFVRSLVFTRRMNSGRVTIESVQFEIIRVSWWCSCSQCPRGGATGPARELCRADFFLTALPFLIKFFLLML